MLQFETLEEILDFAISKENEANIFYTNLSKMTLRPEIKTVFANFALEELGHRKRLEAVKRGDYKLPPLGTVLDLKIADYTVAEDENPEMAYQDSLILAMKREEASFRLYTDLAKITPDEKSRGLFLSLAQEEARHKLRFETEYDQYVLKDN
jgi:rubrerythrin